MGYKYKAAEITSTGGCKGGISYDSKKPDALDVLKRYLIAIQPYMKAGTSMGGDLGVDYLDVLKIFGEIGIDSVPQTKAMKADPAIQQGIINHDLACEMSYDVFKMYDMITGYGVVFSADEAWKLKGGAPGAKVVIQGFGCVGASAAYCFDKMGYTVVGIADANRLVYCPDGLDVKKLVAAKLPKGELDPASFESHYQEMDNSKWVELDCDILVPAALEDVIHKDNAHLVKASLIVEGANIPTTAEADKILFEKGVDVSVDFVASMGGIRIYEALIFRVVEAVPQDIVDDLDQVVRRSTRKLFEEAKKSGRYQRDVAYEIFAPDPSDAPDLL